MNKRYILIFSLILLIIVELKSQTDQIILTQNYQNLSWETFVNEIQKDHQINIYYDQTAIPNFKIQLQTQNKSLLLILDQILEPFDINTFVAPSGDLVISKGIVFKKIKPQLINVSPSVVIKETKPLKTDESMGEFLKTQNEYLATEIVIGNKIMGRTPDKVNIGGHVLNASNKKPVEGATLFFDELGSGVATDQNGYFTYELRPGKYTLIINSISTKDSKIALEVYSAGEANIYLEDQSYMLKEVVVSSKEIDPIKSNQMGVEKITTQSIKEIPLILGEVDILKVAQMLAGVQSTGEGTSGFNVRGSPTDQNLFIINDVHVYNPAHLGGFFSAFNSDAIDDFTLYKSNIPVKYGGRLSSIFDIGAKEGDLKSFKANGGISPITGRLLLEGPIKKEKSSYLMSIRSTYSDWMLKLVKDVEIKNSQAHFGDVFTNFTFILNPKNKVNLFSYYSNDFLSFYQRTNYGYENLGSSIKWRHSINSTDYFDLVLSYSKYSFDEENTELGLQAYKQSNKLEHYEFKANALLTPAEEHSLNFGIHSILYQLDKGDFLPIEQSIIEPKYFGEEKGLETSLYLSDEWWLNDQFTATAGIRFNNYFYLGPQKINNYQDGMPLIPDYLTGITEYGKNEVINSYHHLDFRMATNYIINDELSVKLSYNQLHQYLFMFSNTIAVSPNDKWKLTDANIKPLSGDQLSLGLYSNLYKGKLETSVEVYYKKIHNLVEMRDGADLIINEVPEQNTLQGELEAYGIEMMIKKPRGKLNGWINYTFSNAMVTVDDFYPENRINFGNPYNSNYDRPHAINAVANLKLARRFSLSSNFVYSSGRPITYPAATYYLVGAETLHYSERNEYRIPDYIRWDVSIKMEGSLKKKKLAHGSWSFSVYNLLGRNNAYSVYFKSEEGKIQGYKMSIFGSPIVSLTYNFKLGNYDN